MIDEEWVEPPECPNNHGLMMCLEKPDEALDLFKCIKCDVICLTNKYTKTKKLLKQ